MAHLLAAFNKSQNYTSKAYIYLILCFPCILLLLFTGYVLRADATGYSAGMIALRPDRDGRITGVEGIRTIRQKYGSCIIDEHIPPVGSPTQPVEGGYWANAWMRTW